VKRFHRMCLHCIGSLDSKVPRPLGEALHASRRNQVIPYDFLFVKNTRKFSYVLVLKDDVSHFVELVLSEITDHVVVVHALLDWYKRFGVAETHVSDKGSHFKNKVVAELNDILKTKHRFTTAYSPKSNGTVERVNREIMKVLRSLVSECKISWNEWESLLSLVQSALNNYKSASLAGQAAITVSTGLPAYNPLAFVLQGTDAVSFKQLKMKPDEVLALVTDVKESIEELTRRLRRAVLPKELEAAESLRSTSKLTLRWEITFLLRQHSLERKPRLLLAGLDHSSSWQLSLKKSMPAPCAVITTHL